MGYYEDHFKKRNIQEYTIDGAIDINEWKKSDFKILFLLKENYGYEGCGIFHFSKEAKKWLKDNIKTYIKLVHLAASLHRSKASATPLSHEEIDSLKNERAYLDTTLLKIAVLNIKKHSGESVSKDPEIRDESRVNAPILKRQIEDLKPDVIIAGSTVCWHSLTLDLGIFEEAKQPHKLEAQKINNVILFHGNHPSAWSGGGFNVAEITDEIMKFV